MWFQFAPSSDVADPESWQMYKLGQPISPLDVVYNGSRSLHAVSDEGITVRGVGKASGEQLNIRYVCCHTVTKCMLELMHDGTQQPQLPGWKQNE